MSRVPDLTPNPERLRQLRELYPPDTGGKVPEVVSSNGEAPPSATPPQEAPTGQMTVTSVVKIPMTAVASIVDDAARTLLEGWVGVYTRANVPAAVAVYALDLLRAQIVAKEQKRLGIPMPRPTE